MHTMCKTAYFESYIRAITQLNFEAPLHFFIDNRKGV